MSLVGNYTIATRPQPPTSTTTMAQTYKSSSVASMDMTVVSMELLSGQCVPAGDMAKQVEHCCDI